MKQLLVCLAMGIAMALSSCTTSKTSLTYFEDIKNSQSGEFAASECDYQVKIEADDELFITVTSIIPEATAIYNIPLANPAKMRNLTIFCTMRSKSASVSFGATPRRISRPRSHAPTVFPSTST